MGRPRTGQDTLHAVNHGGDILLHLLLPVQPWDVRRHLSVNGGGVSDQVRPLGVGEDGGGGVGERVRQHDPPQPTFHVHGGGDGPPGQTPTSPSEVAPCTTYKANTRYEMMMIRIICESLACYIKRYTSMNYHYVLTESL